MGTAAKYFPERNTSGFAMSAPVKLSDLRVSATSASIVGARRKPRNLTFWLKPLVFLLCLVPLSLISWDAWQGHLGANPAATGRSIFSWRHWP